MDNENTATPMSVSELKDKIAAEIRPLVPQMKDPEDRFYALVTLLREQWDDKLAMDTFEAAKSIHSAEEKVRSLQSLMSEIGYHERELEERSNP